MVITFASHAKGPWFETRQKQASFCRGAWKNAGLHKWAAARRLGVRSCPLARCSGPTAAFCPPFSSVLLGERSPGGQHPRSWRRPPPRLTWRRGPVAQRITRLTTDQEIAGSTPAWLVVTAPSGMRVLFFFLSLSLSLSLSSPSLFSFPRRPGKARAPRGQEEHWPRLSAPLHCRDRASSPAKLFARLTPM